MGATIFFDGCTVLLTLFEMQLLNNALTSVIYFGFLIFETIVHLCVPV